MKKQQTIPSPFIMLLIPVFVVFLIMVSNFDSPAATAQVYHKSEYFKIPCIHDFIKAIL